MHCRPLWTVLPVQGDFELSCLAKHPSGVTRLTQGTQMGNPLAHASTAGRPRVPVPDIMKIDIETYEFEVLGASIDWISRYRPALQLEVHWAMLHARGKDPSAFLSPLVDLGYRSTDGVRRWFERRNADVTRHSLRV
jgi:hypothetical protein